MLAGAKTRIWSRVGVRGHLAMACDLQVSKLSKSSGLQQRVSCSKWDFLVAVTCSLG